MFDYPENQYARKLQNISVLPDDWQNPKVDSEDYKKVGAKPNDNLYKISEEPEKSKNSDFQKEKNRFESPVKELPKMPSQNELGNQFPPEIVDEIDKLKAELQQKEQEIARFQKIISSQSVTPKKGLDSEEIRAKIARIQLEKQRLIDQKKQNSMSLDFQIFQKTQEKEIENQKKNRELAQRLETLRIIREKEISDLREKAQKAQEYKEQLDFQNQVRNTLKSTFSHPNNIFAKNELFKFSKPNPLARTPADQSFFESLPRFTKKNPKTMSINPITGEVLDTSPFVNGNHPALIRLSEKSLAENGQFKSIGKTENSSEEKLAEKQPSLDHNLKGYGSLIVENRQI